MINKLDKAVFEKGFRQYYETLMKSVIHYQLIVSNSNSKQLQLIIYITRKIFKRSLFN